MLQKDVISQVAQRLNQAEKTREQIRQISLIIHKSPLKTHTLFNVNGLA